MVCRIQNQRFYKNIPAVKRGKHFLYRLFVYRCFIYQRINRISYYRNIREGFFVFSFFFKDGFGISTRKYDIPTLFRKLLYDSNAGIDAGMCAITANGELVGLVEEVGLNYSVIKTVLDSSLEISATIASSGYNGMVKGGYASGLDGYLRMNYLPSSSTIRNNDQVVTTGSTVYPRDLILGYVIDAGFDASGVAKYALLEPAASISNLEQVFILTNYNIG